jgi:hypothetical protein
LTYNHLLGDGLKLLCAAIEPVVRDCMSEITVGKKIDLETVSALLGKIDEEMKVSTHAEFSPLLCCAIPSEFRLDISPEASLLLDESWDIAESPQFSRALHASLNRSMAILLSQLGHSLFSKPMSQDDDQTKVSCPLPTVLVQLKLSRTIFCVENSTSV